MPEVFRRELYASILSGDYLKSVPDYVRQLGFVTEDITGDRIDDPELRSIVRMFGQQGCEHLLSVVDFGGMRDYLLALQCLADFGEFFGFVEKHYDELSTARGMRYWVLECHRNPSSLVAASTPNVPQNVWLYLILSSLFKAKAGKILAYGYATIAAGKGAEGISKGYINLADWLNRKPGAKISAAILDKLVDSLASNLRKIPRRDIPGLKQATKMMFKQRCMYVISTYRGYDPLRNLIEAALREHGLEATLIKTSTVLKEIAGAGAATCRFMQVAGDALIYWQSCHGSHVNDKTKELSGRFLATKAMWDGSRFSLRPSARRMFFVADGEWRDEDFRLLVNSGIDGIYYPEQLNQLVETLIGSSPKRVPAPNCEGR
jgi:hypothetical protein